MKLLNKTISLALLASLIGIQLSASAQQYNVLPPINDIDSQYGTQLPGIPDAGGNVLKGQIATIPTGATFQVITKSTISSVSNQIGDIFSATLMEPITLNGNVIIPAGSEVVGQITYIENAGIASKNAKIDMRFTSIKLPYGQKMPMSGKLMTVNKTGVLEGGSIKKQIAKVATTEAVTTAAGTLTGLSIGAIFGSTGTLTVLGTAAGGFLGVGYLIGKKGKEVTLPGGSKINVLLDQPLTIGR